ncbi:hypothetical protein ASG53_14555 [Sanguibacter sp. Leaf3]|nr:hypothetical protein ASG53_14555 [Sanguibacter sp. Leaf3]
MGASLVRRGRPAGSLDHRSLTRSRPLLTRRSQGRGDVLGAGPQRLGVAGATLVGQGAAG